MQETENKYTPGEWIRDFFNKRWYFVAGAIFLIVIIYVIVKLNKKK